MLWAFFQLYIHTSMLMSLWAQNLTGFGPMMPENCNTCITHTYGVILIRQRFRFLRSLLTGLNCATRPSVLTRYPMFQVFATSVLWRLTLDLVVAIPVALQLPLQCMWTVLYETPNLLQTIANGTTSCFLNERPDLCLTAPEELES